jgi:acyl-[acyl carrier protein]--UDP-N-acetylglucosamine O-acyltransferase
LNGLHETITFAVAELVLNALFGADVALAVLLDILLAIFVGVTVGAAAVYGGVAALASDGIGAHVASNVQAANHGLEALGLKRVDETTLTNAP